MAPFRFALATVVWVAACSKSTPTQGMGAGGGEAPSVAAAIAAAVKGPERAPPSATAAASGPTAPTLELVTLRDPVEGAYTIGVPKGWQSSTYSSRALDVHSSVTTSVSPDGSVVLFLGDPSLPQHVSPRAATPLHRELARKHPRMRIEAFVPATTYFAHYVKRKFGALPGFALGTVEADPAGEAKMRARFAEVGLPMKPTLARVAFRYMDGAKAMRALVLGSTSDSGSFWVVTVAGVATTGEPSAYVPMLEAMGRSQQMDAGWQAEQNRKHQARMAQIQAFGRQMTARHRANMAWLQRSAASHQQRMKALAAQSDASVQRFNERMKAGDASHRRFLNAIHEEHTVGDSKGRTYQVDHSYQRYYVNKRTGAYVGGDLRLGEDTLRAWKLNPDDYEEVRIQR